MMGTEIDDQGNDDTTVTVYRITSLGHYVVELSRHLRERFASLPDCLSGPAAAVLCRDGSGDRIPYAAVLVRNTSGHDELVGLVPSDAGGAEHLDDFFPRRGAPYERFVVTHLFRNWPGGE